MRAGAQDETKVAGTRAAGDWGALGARSEPHTEAGRAACTVQRGERKHEAHEPHEPHKPHKQRAQAQQRSLGPAARRRAAEEQQAGQSRAARPRPARLH